MGWGVIYKGHSHSNYIFCKFIQTLGGVMKLLFILLLGLGFTQTKLETRLFEISSDDARDVTENFYMFELSEIIGFETDFALISPYVEFPYGADISSYVFMFC